MSRPDGVPPTSRSTPQPHEDASRLAGHVDWRSPGGLPLRAVLHQDGRWTCNDGGVEAMLNLRYGSDYDGHGPGAGFGLLALREVAERFKGELHYLLPPDPPLEDDEVE